MTSRTPTRGKKPSTPKKESEGHALPRTPPSQSRVERPPASSVPKAGPFLVEALGEPAPNQRPRFLRINVNPADVAALGLKAGDLASIGAQENDGKPTEVCGDKSRGINGRSMRNKLFMTYVQIIDNRLNMAQSINFPRQ